MATQVATGKGAVTGALFRAPIGTTLPTDASTDLNAAFKSLGYISEDGMTNSNSPSSNEIKSWGGVVVATVSAEKTDTFAVSLIEGTNIEALKTVYGDDNVTGTLSTGIKITSSNDDLGYNEFVFEVIYGEALHRIVIPKGKVTAVGDIVYNDSDAVAYPITITAVADAQGNTHYEYIKE